MRISRLILVCQLSWIFLAPAHADVGSCGQLSYQQSCENWNCGFNANFDEKEQKLAAVLPGSIDITKVTCFDSPYCLWCKGRSGAEAALQILRDQTNVVRENSCLSGAHHMLSLEALVDLNGKPARLYVSNTGLACLKTKDARWDWSTVFAPKEERPSAHAPAQE